jgi:hypothetical protein
MAVVKTNAIGVHRRTLVPSWSDQRQCGGAGGHSNGAGWCPAPDERGLTQLTCRADDRGKGVPAEGERELMNTSLTTGNLSNGPVGQNRGAVLTAGNYLRVNDYMYATVPGKYAYFAVLQGNAT